MQAESCYKKFVSRVEGAYSGEKVKSGVFAAMMDVGLINDVSAALSFSACGRAYNALNAPEACCLLQGPVTIIFDSKNPGGR